MNKLVDEAPYHPGYEDAVVNPAQKYKGMNPAKMIWNNNELLRQQADRIAKLEKKLQESAMNFSCSECGADGGHALYCVLCAEKFVGGYKESVPVHASELLTQVSTDTQYAGNGTAGIQNETKPTGFFFQIPPQTKPLSDEEIKEVWLKRPANTAEDVVRFARAIEERHGIK